MTKRASAEFTAKPLESAQERFDYTEWRRANLWADATADEILEQAAANDPIGTSFGSE
jgi:hypothetical protein